MQGLAEVGYDRLTMEMVAALARAGKGALYRRWSCKADLVADALAAGHPKLETPDTGSLRGDIEAFLAQAPDHPGDAQMLTVVTGLFTAASRNPDLAAAFRKRFIEPRKQIMRTIVRRGIARGEIPPGRDFELIIETVPAFLFSQGVVSHHPVDSKLPRRVMLEIVYPLLVAPESLRWERS